MVAHLCQLFRYLPLFPLTTHWIFSHFVTVSTSNISCLSVAIGHMSLDIEFLCDSD